MLLIQKCVHRTKGSKRKIVDGQIFEKAVNLGLYVVATLQGFRKSNLIRVYSLTPQFIFKPTLPLYLMKQVKVQLEKVPFPFFFLHHLCTTQVNFNLLGVVFPFFLAFTHSLTNVRWKSHCLKRRKRRIKILPSHQTRYLGW